MNYLLIATCIFSISPINGKFDTCADIIASEPVQTFEDCIFNSPVGNGNCCTCVIDTNNPLQCAVGEACIAIPCQRGTNNMLSGTGEDIATTESFEDTEDAEDMDTTDHPESDSMTNTNSNSDSSDTAISGSLSSSSNNNSDSSLSSGEDSNDSISDGNSSDSISDDNSAESESLPSSSNSNSDETIGSSDSNEQSSEDAAGEDANTNESSNERTQRNTGGFKGDNSENVGMGNDNANGSILQLVLISITISLVCIGIIGGFWCFFYVRSKNAHFEIEVASHVTEQEFAVMIAQNESNEKHTSKDEERI